jgi:hypothetical protein
VAAPRRKLSEYDLDDKADPFWWLGSFIWGVLAICLVISLLQWLDLFNLWTYVILGVVGLLLSLRVAAQWMKGGLEPSEPAPMSIKFSDTPEDRGKYNFQIYGKQKTAVGPRVKQPTVTQGTYVLWWLFVRLPALIGDRLLSWFWTLVGPHVLPRAPSVLETLTRTREARARYGGSRIMQEAQELGLVDIDPSDEELLRRPYDEEF